jgi:hypothetical protein
MSFKYSLYKEKNFPAAYHALWKIPRRRLDHSQRAEGIGA